MKCQRCNSERVATVNGKSGDCTCVSMGDKEQIDYVPNDMGIGGGDYVNFSWCLDCGQIQGEFPMVKTELENDDESNDG